MAHHKITTMDRDLSGRLQRAVGRGRASRRMTANWTGSYIASMPMWWVGKRARTVKLRRKEWWQ